jgi:hypothetical protein
MVRDLAGIAPAKEPVLALSLNIKAGFVIDLFEPDPQLRVVGAE